MPTNGELCLQSLSDRLDLLIIDIERQSMRWWNAGEQDVAERLDRLANALVMVRVQQLRRHA